MNIEVEDHTDEVMEEFKTAIKKALFIMGETAAGYAQQNLTDGGHVDTGRLRASIAHQESQEDHSTTIGTNVEYAPYVEFGTGKYSTVGGRKTPWNYKDAKGEWHHTGGSHAYPYLRPAIADHKSEYADIIKGELE